MLYDDETDPDEAEESAADASGPEPKEADEDVPETEFEIIAREEYLEYEDDDGAGDGAEADGEEEKADGEEANEEGKEANEEGGELKVDDVKLKVEGEESKSEGKNSEEYCKMEEDWFAPFLETTIPCCAEDTLIGKTHTWKDVKNLMMKASYKNSTHYVSYNY